MARHIVNEQFVHEDVSVPVAEIRAIEQKRTTAGKLFLLAGCICALLLLFTFVATGTGDSPSASVALCSVAGSILVGLSYAWGWSLVISTDEHTFQVKGTKGAIGEMCSQINRAREQSAHL